LATIGWNLRLYSFDGAAVKQEFAFRTDQACLSCDWHVESGVHGQIVTCGTGGANSRGSNLVVWDVDLTAQAAAEQAGQGAQAGVEAKIFQLPPDHHLARLDIYDVAFVPGTRGEQVVCACRAAGSLDRASSLWRVSVRPDQIHNSTKLWESDEAHVTGLRWCPAENSNPDFPHSTFGFLTTRHSTGAQEVHINSQGGRYALDTQIDPIRLPENSRTLAWWPWLEAPAVAAVGVGALDGTPPSPVFRCATFGETVTSAGQLAIWRVQEGAQLRKEFEMALSGGDKDAPKGSDYVSSLAWSRHPSPKEADFIAYAFTYRLQIINLKTD